MVEVSRVWRVGGRLGGEKGVWVRVGRRGTALVVGKGCGLVVIGVIETTFEVGREVVRVQSCC